MTEALAAQRLGDPIPKLLRSRGEVWKRRWGEGFWTANF